jgi:ParB-like chromosome segregation protein Spo0J
MPLVIPPVAARIDHSIDESTTVRWIEPRSLTANPLSLSVYGEPSEQLEDLMESVQAHGILVPLVVAAGPERGIWEILSGHRRWACALALELADVPCEVRKIDSETSRQRLVLEFNRQRRKTFSQLMREADVLDGLLSEEARQRRLANLRPRSSRQVKPLSASRSDERRIFDDQDESSKMADNPKPLSRKQGRTDAEIAERLGLGGKDLYRQARAIWRMASQGDCRAQNGVAQLDAGTKTIHAAYKDLRRRNRFAADFRPTPYDIWAFRHDRAFGIPHPGSIPAAIIAHALHYFSPPGGLVVDPMAGGGTTLDVCQSMGRRCLAYDLDPARPEILRHDIREGFPVETIGCDLIFCDPPYHTMMAHMYSTECIASASLEGWLTFLHDLTRHALATLRPGGYLALLLASQTEKDLPAGYGYLDHTFMGYAAALQAGFMPERRISCPMSSSYLPQHVRRARIEGRMLGQVRDLLVVRKPAHAGGAAAGFIPFSQSCPGGHQRLFCE